MGRLIKILLVLVASVVGIAVIAAVALFVFFDPNDFRDRISVAVQKETGRELTIEGDLSLSVFPWLAVEIGKTSLGNAAGFGDEPFLSFEQARLSVKLMPLLFSQRVEIGTASLDALVVNLAVKENGVSNWDDLSERDAASAAQPAGSDADASGESPTLDIANVRVSDAMIAYKDMQAGASYAISRLSMNTGRIAAGAPFDIDAEFDFESDPGELGGSVSIRGTVLMSDDADELSVDGLNIAGKLRGIAPQPTDFNFDSRAVNVNLASETASLGEMDLELLGLALTANVAPFSYAGTPEPRAELRVHEFSLKELMQTLGEVAPETIDPDALTRVSFSGNAVVGQTAIAINDISLQLDDTRMSGKLSIPTADGGLMQFDLAADTINVDNYMPPAGDVEVADEEAAPIDIPVDMIRALNARGTFRLQKALLSGMTFDNVEVGLNSAAGKLRLHPVSAELFDGAYNGDVQIDASTDTPTLSVNENIVGVQLTPLVQAMFDVANVAGTINGRFVLAGRGPDLDAIRQDLDGNIAFELKDGVWKGVDVWYQLRRARALLRQEPPPEAKVPVQTEFSQVATSGNVVDGIFRSDNLIAELPFMRITGTGIVNFAAGNVDYSLEANVLEKPELMSSATDAEIADFTAAVVPLKISGPLTAPEFGIDIEGMLRREVERAVEKEKDRLKDKLLESVFGGGKKDEEEGDAEENLADPDNKKKKKKNPLEDALKDLIGD